MSVERAMQYGIVQGDPPSHHTPRRDIIAQVPVSNNIAQLAGLGPDSPE